MPHWPQERRDAVAAIAGRLLDQIADCGRDPEHAIAEAREELYEALEERGSMHIASAVAIALAKASRAHRKLMARELAQ